MYLQPAVDPELVVKIDDIYLRNLDMPDLIGKAKAAVNGHAAKLLKEDPTRMIKYIVLDMPCTLFMLRSHRYACLSQICWSCCCVTSTCAVLYTKPPSLRC